MRDALLPPAFSADDMRKQWVPFWTPSQTPSGTPEGWKALAEGAGMSRQERRAWNVPTRERFLDAVDRMAGTAGFDGWEAAELQGLFRCCPWLASEFINVVVGAILLAKKEGRPMA